jgi:predicted nuclease of predicted toxin-antitoxin system
MAVGLLLDEHVSERLAARLRSRFPNVVHVRTRSYGGAADRVVAEAARNEDRTLVMRDQILLSLSFRVGVPPLGL